MAELIYASLREAQKQNEYAEFFQVHCCLEGGPELCPHYQKHACLKLGIIGLSPCLYGNVNISRSASTKRGKSYRDFVAEKKREVEELRKVRPDLKFTNGSLVRIGDYVTVPFMWASDCEAVPFHRHGGLISSGIPWIKAEDFTGDAVLTLVSFKPRSFGGEEITRYRLEEVPKFLYQLRLRFPDLYAQAVEKDPSIAERTPKATQFAGRMVPVAKLKPGSVTIKYEFGRSVGRDPLVVPATWDGEKVTMELKSSDLIYLAGYGTDVTVTFVPNERTTAVVPDDEIERLWEEGAFEER